LKEQDNIFYVYAHYRASGKKKNEIFYVGKGYGKRAYTKENRNKYWHNIVNKYDYYVEVLYDNLDEQTSFSLEIATIARYGRKDLKLGPLVNLSDGGEGPSGCIRTQEQKDNISKSKKGIKQPKDAVARRAKSNSKPIVCYIIINNEEIILDRFDSLQSAGDKTNLESTHISKASIGKYTYSGTYNINTKQYNERRFAGNYIIPNNKYPSTYKCYWRKENSKTYVKPIIVSRDLIECYIILDDKEIILDTFVSSVDAADKINGYDSGINAATTGKRKSSGTYNLDTKQYNENKFSTKSALPNNDYPTTYRCKWRRIKE
jgi:hypothetical protein